MERHLYRFRTADRLLGTDATECKAAVPGELEKLEIYFAPPEQLNDPLEGYREIYWSGDKIVWMNFFRHYLLILALRSWQIDDISRGVPLPKDLPVWQYPSQFEGVFLAAYREMDEILQADAVFHGYANAFAKDENKHYKPQLSHYLRGLHDRFLAIVLTVNDMHYMTDVKHNEPPFSPLADREFHVTTIAEIEKYGSVGRNFGTYRQVALQLSAYEIKTFNILPAPHTDLQELTAAFVPRYLDQIEQLMHPKWYVACFMKECDNSAIWGSYGDNHKGICLKYRVSGQEPELAMEVNIPCGLGHRGIEFSFQNMQFKEVFYDREHSEIDFFRSLGNVPNEALGGFWYNDGHRNLSTASEWYKTDSSDLREKHWSNFDFALTSKLPQWESEKEYRLVLNSGMDITDKKHRILKYRFSSLEGLIFGIKTPLEHKLKSIRIIKAHCELEGREEFQFYQAYYDPETKSIQHGLLPVSIHDADINAGTAEPGASSTV
ncbi:DUF2971 domain-containing protein [Pseudomonas fluorescens]|uniref:DUF2971 domain-containing protein n=1 Tax=Pseudomonas fluorescens TaxID=294 RepID=UPI001BDA677F|nr:DUF2971 domain-containing protein [Pseudomonas fluorescens]MBT0622553.1 DUF2971 domain-containing protein [Pseudomonas fluorescens]